MRATFSSASHVCVILGLYDEAASADAAPLRKRIAELEAALRAAIALIRADDHPTQQGVADNFEKTLNGWEQFAMCKICHDAMATARQTGLATPDAWERADAAIKAWRAANPELEFDGVIVETAAWAAHMAAAE